MGTHRNRNSHLLQDVSRYNREGVRIHMKLQAKFLFGMLLILMGQGCVTTTGPLATLPIVSPTASDLNLSGIKAYQRGKWELARQHFLEAVDADSSLPEAHFNLALTLHKLGRHSRATEHFQIAGSLAPSNDSIIKSTLYRNHLGLSSTFERHISGGYRYAQ